MKVLLISNSKSLLDKKLGKEIDKFDGVCCRFNNYEISDKFAPFTGTRTDWLAQRSCSDIRRRNPDYLDRVLLFVTYCELSHIMKGVARSYQQYYGKKTTIVDVNKTIKTHKKLGLPPGKRCSVGILAIDYLLDFDYEVYLLGFDGGKEYTVSHYFEKQPVDATNHCFDLEWRHIDMLRESGKVKDF